MLVARESRGRAPRYALALCLFACACSRSAQTPHQPAAGDATQGTVAAAQAFLATLDDAQRARASFSFDSDLKSRWSNFPVGMVPRNGVRWGDLQPAQREAALKLLAVALSEQGLRKTREIMDGDEVLKATAGGGGPNFGRDEYYLGFFGTPSAAQPWMIQFGGHHLALNLTVAGRNNVLTPSLPAAQPAKYELEGKTVRPLGHEQDRSFALVSALDAAQRRKAVLDYQVSDLVLGPGEDGKTIQPEGIPASELNAAQQRMLLDLAHEWVGILNDAAAATKMQEIEAHLPETWFAWSGPLTSAGTSYFRIQGPTLVIEYAPQRRRGGSGLDPDHIHTIYRDPTNDYGARLIK
jgi:hypothetical protein